MQGALRKSAGSAAKRGLCGQRREMATLLRSTLVAHATKYPVKDAVRCAGGSSIQGAEDNFWTQGQVCEQSGAVGNGLLELVRSGETVALAVGNSVERIAVQQGAAAAGVRLADAGTGLTSAGVAKMLNEQKVKLLIVAPSELPAVYEAIPELKSISKTGSMRLSLEAFPELDYVCSTGLQPMNGTQRFKDLLVYNSMRNDIEALGEEDRPFLAQVDPSTGSVKSELTQAAVLEQAAAKTKELKIAPEANVVFTSKANDATNLCLATVACALNNAQLVVASESYDEAAISAAKEKTDSKVSFGG